MSSHKIRRGPAWVSMRVPGGANKFQLQLPSNSTLFQCRKEECTGNLVQHATYTIVMVMLFVLGKCGDALKVGENRDHLQDAVINANLKASHMNVFHIGNNADPLHRMWRLIKESSVQTLNANLKSAEIL